MARHLPLWRGAAQSDLHPLHSGSMKLQATQEEVEIPSTLSQGHSLPLGESGGDRTDQYATPISGVAGLAFLGGWCGMCTAVMKRMCRGCCVHATMCFTVYPQMWQYFYGMTVYEALARHAKRQQEEHSGPGPKRDREEVGVAISVCCVFLLGGAIAPSPWDMLLPFLLNGCASGVRCWWRICESDRRQRHV